MVRWDALVPNRPDVHEPSCLRRDRIQAMESSLEHLARKYVWWEPPARALSRTNLFLCQLMQLGTWDDVRTVRRRFGDEALRRALREAPPGVLDRKSWIYWHRFLGIEPIPPLPERPLP